MNKQSKIKTGLPSSRIAFLHVTEKGDVVIYYKDGEIEKLKKE